MDDPISSLDNKVSELILRGIREDEVLKEKTFIFSTNNLGILNHADRIIFIENGKIIYFDTLEKLKKTPEFQEISIPEKNEKVKNFLKKIRK